jgi:putative endonuclease
MFYVYVIRSLSHAKRYYIGFTENIDQRVKEHNEGKSLHTAKYGPWELAVYLAVPSKTKALDLERYLKSGSGRAFLQRHIL